MLDIDAIRKRALAASTNATEALQESQEKNARLLEHAAQDTPETATACDAPDAMAAPSIPQETGQDAASTQSQVEILGQVLDADSLAQMMANTEQMQKMVQDAVAQATASGLEDMMGHLFGEDMGVLAAAMETLAMEDGEEDEEDQEPESEQMLYNLLEETMARLEALPEPAPVPYPKEGPPWEQFGILLSGIVSCLNGHSLDRMDVEEHVPVLEQQVVSIVRRSWGIDGRKDLLDMIRYLAQEGYILRYQLYAGAASPEELMDEDMDEADRESSCRAWRFVQQYKAQYHPGFLAGWDVGRAAMLARWGCYLGWITESEAIGILWELSGKAAEHLHSWREFAQSYLFGGLMWKLLSGDSSAASYLGYIADAATDLLTGQPGSDGGQWRNCPWPAQRKIGFTL